MSSVEEHEIEEGKKALVINKTAEERAQERVMDVLAEIGGNKVADDDLLFEGNKFILPQSMDPRGAIKFLENHIEQNETETMFSRTYNYRFYDGCHALDLAIREVFGTAGIARATVSFFSSTPPELKEVKTDVDQSKQVPVGRIEVPMIEGVLTTTTTHHPEYGQLFQIVANTKRKYRSHVEGLFRVVDEMLKDKSIYKGKAFDGQQEPEFLDVSKLDESKIIFNDDVMTQLDANVWSLLDHSDEMIRRGLPLKRAVLLEGPYGTGKSSAGWITAKKALDNGWSFIMCRPGKDNLSEVMQTARLYEPAVVFFEDVDTIAQSGESDDVTRLLDLFDGISSKGTQLMAVMTTNNVDRIHKGMLRPGRLDAVIHIGALDSDGIQRLIRSVVDENTLDDDIDWDAVAKANEHYLPAYIREGVDRAMRYAIINGSDRIGTDELVASADGLRQQWSLQQEAGEGEQMPNLDRSMREAIADVVDGMQIMDEDDPHQNDAVPIFEGNSIKARGTDNGYGASRV